MLRALKIFCKNEYKCILILKGIIGPIKGVKRSSILKCLIHVYLIIAVFIPIKVMKFVLIMMMKLFKSEERTIFIKAKSRKYQGVFEVKSRVKTWQVRGIWSQQLKHKQVPQWGTEPGVRKGKRSLL